MKTFPKPSLVAMAVSVALLQVGAAYAQQAADSNSNVADGLKLDSVVVTATTTKVSKMKSSVSVSGLDADQILQQAPTNAAEALRSIPGVRSESSGGESNANITVRGVPISAGGARYVQIQEDGLPIIQFGDVAFGTADSFLRVDGSLDYLEVIRGGSASTMATNSPGGVINFISKTGETEGGMVSYTTGLGFTSNRFDFSLGKHLSEDTRMHIGGFYRKGENTRDINFTSEDGGQIKLNLTKDVKNGFIRASLKMLDDTTPVLLPVPVSAQGGRISQLPGIDARKAFYLNSSFPADVIKNESGGRVASNVQDGLTVESLAFGLEGNFNLDNGWNVSDKFRIASNKGRFIGMLPISEVQTSPGNYSFATGPQTGQAYNGGVFTGLLFNTDVRDLGNMVNDLKFSKAMKDAEGNKTTVSGGLYVSRQANSQVWNWNFYRVSADGSNPQLINDATAANPTSPVTATDIAYRAWDVDYTTVAPYLGLGYETGPWTLDGSIRYDKLSAKGYANSTVSLATGGLDPAARRSVDYTQSEASYSMGANYQWNKDLALFGRTSRGYSFPSDRVLFDGATNVRNGSTVAVYEVNQHEAGVKYRQGGLSMFTTFFMANTKESNFDITCAGGAGCLTKNEYDAKGVELEAAYRVGGFKLSGGVTYTDAEIVASLNPANVGHRPRRQADYIYQVSPSYNLGAHTVGLALIGTTDSFTQDDNAVKMKGFNVLNAFYNMQVTKDVNVSLSVNNLLNEVGFTEAEPQGTGYIARSINGRTARATVRYTF
ncbi:MAG: TonB-dependent receptor domain-containing protein [Limnobacter sp.]|uniref:TonB-dependent receptor domain-containing protein n=1 Tax=Limnobacter sp. TaxID=2003368 RepID=UPI00391D9C3F